jgi:putative transposase
MGDSWMAWNTPTTMDQRTRMMLEHADGAYSLAALARRYGVSRKTAYKWIGRFDAESWSGLQDRSRAPQRQAAAIQEDIIERILAMKARWPLWGAPKLHFKLLQQVGEEACPSESSVSNVLHRHGLTRAPKRRRMAHPSTVPAYGQQPNDVWCADFKGWWWLRNGVKCTPLTITDASSRFLIRCHALGEATDTAVVRAVFTAAFREHGLPAAMRTDNGPPFASNGLQRLSRLSVWWLKLGIHLERIEPGHPEQNGRHERMHRTLKEHMGEAKGSLKAQQQELARFREHYNHERPHEALDFAVPAARYAASTREWSERPLGAMEYPEDWVVRKVRKSGQMKWGGQDVRVSDALAGEHVGLRPESDGVWTVCFGDYELGRFDERKGRVEVPRRRKATTKEGPQAQAAAGKSPTSLRSAVNIPAAACANSQLNP